jgi:hypothetical protein
VNLYKTILHMDVAKSPFKNEMTLLVSKFRLVFREVFDEMMLFRKDDVDLSRGHLGSCRLFSYVNRCRRHVCGSWAALMIFMMMRVSFGDCD